MDADIFRNHEPLPTSDEAVVTGLLFSVAADLARVLGMETTERLEVFIYRADRADKGELSSEEYLRICRARLEGFKRKSTAIRELIGDTPIFLWNGDEPRPNPPH